jgi:glycerophosphoryl diester phosphodiesterase
LAAHLVVVGHRGAAGYAPENTIPSFRKAIELGVDAVELDVHMSRDGRIVVIHDDTLDRTTDGTGSVHDRTLAELKKLDAGLKFGRRWRGTRIPTLEEVFDEVGVFEYRIEVKRGGKVYRGMERKLLECVREYGLLDRVVFTSFDYDALERMKRKERRAQTGIIMQGRVRWFIPMTKKLGCSWINARHELVTAEDVVAAHVGGLKLGVWTVDTRQAAERTARLGVDGVTTNYPDVVIDVVRRGGRKRGSASAY